MSERGGARSSKDSDGEERQGQQAPRAAVAVAVEGQPVSANTLLHVIQRAASGTLPASDANNAVYALLSLVHEDRAAQELRALFGNIFQSPALSNQLALCQSANSAAQIMHQQTKQTTLFLVLLTCAVVNTLQATQGRPVADLQALRRVLEAHRTDIQALGLFSQRVSLVQRLLPASRLIFLRVCLVSLQSLPN